MRTGIDPAANAQSLRKAVEAAMAHAPDVIVTPEATNLVQKNPSEQASKALIFEDDPCLAEAQALSSRFEGTLIIGSLIVRPGPQSERLVNRSVVLDAGSVTAHYDKIHLFDADPQADERYQESRGVCPGTRAVVVRTALTPIGLSICYDVRFAALYHALAQAGAALIMVPAAFTVPTGEAHWEILLRARAIETGCFIAAPAQGGTHGDGRRTYGHSMIINPWGQVIARLAHDEPGLLVAEINLDEVHTARRRIASLSHGREFSKPVTLS
jgi:deaminated glutathione amidase